MTFRTLRALRCPRPRRRLTTPVPGAPAIDPASTDRTAFEILVREHAPMLLTYLRSLLRDHAAVDDVFQESLVTAWRTLDRFDHDRPFAPWLRGIARNLVMAHHRKNRRLPATCEEAVLAHLDRRLDEVGRRSGDTWDEKLEALDDCLDRLPDETRTLLDWHYRLELNTERIAARLESNRETVKKRLQRARGRLLDCLTAKGVLSKDVLSGGDPAPEMTT